MQTQTEAPIPSEFPHWLRNLIGILLIIMPFGQIISALAPFKNLIGLLPIPLILEQILQAFIPINAVLIASLLMLIAGLLWLFKSRHAFALSLGSVGFLFIWAFESGIIMAYSLLNAGDARPFMIAMAKEVLEMLYYMPLIFFVLQLGILVILLRQTTRTALAVTRKDFKIGLGILLFLIVNLHVSLLLVYFQNQS
jgi:L-asparagine transporter-like permease